MHVSEDDYDEEFELIVENAVRRRQEMQRQQGAREATTGIRGAPSAVPGQPTRTAYEHGRYHGNLSADHLLDPESYDIHP